MGLAAQDVMQGWDTSECGDAERDSGFLIWGLVRIWHSGYSVCDFEAELLHAVNRKLETMSKAYAQSDNQNKMVR